MPRAPVALLLTVLVAIVAPACDNGDETANEIGTTTTEPAIEDVVVVVDDRGRVATLDAATGEEIDELFAGVPVDDPSKNGISVTPDGRTAYVARPTPAGEPGLGDIVRVPVAGGEPEVVVAGRAPAVSPDGNTLAYVATEPGDVLPEPVLVLRDLNTGDERRLTRDTAFHFIGDVAWTADGDNVAFTAGEIYTALYIVGRSATSLNDARRAGPDARGEKPSWRAVAPLGDDRLAVVESCCEVEDLERWFVIAVDVATGSVEGPVVPRDRIEATDLESDEAAERLLIVARHGDSPTDSRLLRWDGGATEPEEVADGVVVAAW